MAKAPAMPKKVVCSKRQMRITKGGRPSMFTTCVIEGEEDVTLVVFGEGYTVKGMTSLDEALGTKYAHLIGKSLKAEKVAIEQLGM